MHLCMHYLTWHQYTWQNSIQYLPVCVLQHCLCACRLHCSWTPWLTLVSAICLFCCIPIAVETGSKLVLIVRPDYAQTALQWWERLTSGIRTLQPLSDDNTNYLMQYPVIMPLGGPSIQRNVHVCVTLKDVMYAYKPPFQKLPEQRQITGGYWRGTVTTAWDSNAGCSAPAVQVAASVDAFLQHKDEVLQDIVYAGLDSQGEGEYLACNPKAGYGPGFARVDVDNNYVIEVDPPSLGEQSKLVLTNSVSGCSVVAAWDPVRLKLLLYHQQPADATLERFYGCSSDPSKYTLAGQLAEKHLFQRITLRGMTPFAVVGPSLYRSNLDGTLGYAENPPSTATIVVELKAATASQWQVHLAMQVHHNLKVKVSMAFPKDKASWLSLKAGQQSIVTLFNNGDLNEVAYITSDRYCVEAAGET